MNRNQLVRVSATDPHWASFSAYFQFFGTGPSTGTAVLSLNPTDESDDSYKGSTLIAVDAAHILPV